MSVGVGEQGLARGSLTVLWEAYVRRALHLILGEPLG